MFISRLFEWFDYEIIEINSFSKEIIYIIRILGMNSKKTRVMKTGKKY